MCSLTTNSNDDSRHVGIVVGIRGDLGMAVAHCVGIGRVFLAPIHSRQCRNLELGSWITLTVVRNDYSTYASFKWSPSCQWVCLGKPELTDPRLPTSIESNRSGIPYVQLEAPLLVGGSNEKKKLHIAYNPLLGRVNIRNQSGCETGDCFVGSVAAVNADEANGECWWALRQNIKPLENATTIFKENVRCCHAKFVRFDAEFRATLKIEDGSLSVAGAVDFGWNGMENKLRALCSRKIQIWLGNEPAIASKSPMRCFYAEILDEENSDDEKESVQVVRKEPTLKFNSSVAQLEDLKKCRATLKQIVDDWKLSKAINKRNPELLKEIKALVEKK